MIYRVNDGYVVSSRGQWLPGSYVDERAARYAYRFSCEDLERLSAERGTGTGYRLISFEDMQEFRRRRAGKA